MLRAVAIAFVAGGCSAAPPPDHHGHAGTGEARAALADGDAVSAAVDQSCTTSVVNALSTQLIDEIQCLRPGTFASLSGASGIALGNAAFPWLQTPAREALLRVQTRRGVTMQINSALRTLPQQYILYRWYMAGRCGIGLAAEPGKSNHESGLAVDVEDDAGWQSAMSAEGFQWLGASDPVHFDYVGEGSVDIGGLSVLAFQKLWNLNRPDDRIEEDSTYGTATEERIAKSPIGGFALGADCNKPPPPPPPPDAGTPSAAPAPEEGCAAAPGTSKAGSGFALPIALWLLRRRRSVSRRSGRG